MDGQGDMPAPERGLPHPLRHGLGFLVSGGTAFLVDAAVLELLTAGLGVHPILARLFAISLAMVAGWLMHRRLTFAMPTPPNLAEFLRYAGVAWTAAAVNYGLFALIVLVRPGIEPLVALVISSVAAMVLAYLGMRFGAFRRRG
jgi:putative flippase GtrA